MLSAQTPQLWRSILIISPLSTPASPHRARMTNVTLLVEAVSSSLGNLETRWIFTLVCCTVLVTDVQDGPLAGGDTAAVRVAV